MSNKTRKKNNGNPFNKIKANFQQNPSIFNNLNSKDDIINFRNDIKEKINKYIKDNLEGFLKNKEEIKFQTSENFQEEPNYEEEDKHQFNQKENEELKYKCGSKSEIKKFNAQPEINKIKINKKVLAEKSNKNNKQKKNLDISQFFNNKLYKGKNKQRNRKLEFYSSKNKNKAKYNSFAENKEKLTTTEKELYIEKKFNIQKEKSEIITFSQDSNNKKTLSESLDDFLKNLHRENKDFMKDMREMMLYFFKLQRNENELFVKSIANEMKKSNNDFINKFFEKYDKNNKNDRKGKKLLNKGKQR